MPRRLVVAGALIIAGLAATLVLWPRPISLSCSDFTMEREPKVRFVPSRLTLRFIGHAPDGFSYGPATLPLTATVNFSQPVQPGAYLLRGAGKQGAREWEFEPSAKHDPRVTSASLIFDGLTRPVVGEQEVTGELRIEVLTDAELRGSIELRASGDVGCQGSARIATPFAVKLSGGRSE